MGTLRIVSAVSLLLACCVLVSAAEPAKPWTYLGYRGPDGTGVYTDCTPPLQWDEPKGENVRWEVPLPSWGHGSPIVVPAKEPGAPARVFVTCEVTPTHDFPLLLCLDADTGKVLWQRELDHLASLAPDAEKREALRADWHAVREYVSGCKRYLYKERQGTLTPEEAAAGAIYNQRLRNPAIAGRVRNCTRAGLWHETWNEALFHNTTLACIGYAYATPASDGDYVYAVTSFGGVFCYDMDGNLRWQQATPCPKPSQVQSNGSIEHCQNGRSPIIHDGILVSDITNYVRAFSTKTGELLWSDLGPGAAGSSTIVSPGVLTVNGTDIVWAAGCCAYRLSDGKRLKVEGWKDEGMQTLVKYDEPDVVFFCGTGEHCGWTDKGNAKAEFRPPAAVRFTLEGDTLKAHVLWHGGDLGDYTGRVCNSNKPWLLYYDGKLYNDANGGYLHDALTGKVLSEGSDRNNAAKRVVPRTSHLLLVAGKYVFGLTRGGKSDQFNLKRDDVDAVCDIFTVDGTHVATNVFATPKVTPEQQDMVIAATSVDSWREFSYGWTFSFGGDRLYARSYSTLICIGK